HCRSFERLPIRMWKRLRSALGGLFGRHSASTPPSHDGSIPPSGTVDRQAGGAEGPVPITAPAASQGSYQVSVEPAQSQAGTARDVMPQQMSSDAGAIGNVTLAADELDATHDSREAAEHADADQRRGRPGQRRRPLQADRASFGEELWGVSER